MWWGIGLLIAVPCILAFLISRAGTLADRAIGRDPEVGTAAKDVATDARTSDLQPGRSEDQISRQRILRRENQEPVRAEP